MLYPFCYCGRQFPQGCHYEVAQGGAGMRYGQALVGVNEGVEGYDVDVDAAVAVGAVGVAVRQRRYASFDGL